jgi:hypothetical protein
METCFVIQPFDKDKFDQRYADIFKPAIENANLKPYRVDGDLSSRVPIEDIEKHIGDSAICFADITIDNPNVWYELGYAFACGKDVVMVCSDERQGKFPFDIQHRHIITYKTRSTSDFKSLEETITSKIKALQQKTKRVTSLNSLPVVDREGLQGHEIAILIISIENQFSNEDSMSIYTLKEEMGKAGYTDVATSVGLRTLIKKGMIATSMEHDGYNNHEPFLVCRLTDDGEGLGLSQPRQA